MTVHSASATFVDRHIGARRGAHVDAMLKAVGFDTVDALVDTAVPKDIRQDSALELSAALSEVEALAELRKLAAKNKTAVQMIGQGYYDTVTPPVIRRNILESPAWYTAYTPYQPEISQGRLEALLNFQTMVQDLVGLPIANASLLDEATAVAEAVLLMRRANKNAGAKDGKTVLDADCLPQTIAIVRGRAEALGFEVEVADLSKGLPGGDINGVVLQQPGVSGRVFDHSGIIAAAKERGALVTVSADLLALTLITPPGEQGADIAVGSAQRLGVPLFYGGPHAAYMAVQKGLERSLPGRLVGVSKDSAGVPAYRLALQTREQHIRREKATSNICTAQALLAIVASMYTMFLLVLPSGVLADTTDRRRLILSALAVQSGTVIVLALLVLAGVAGPATLLFFTFVAGCCTALFSPAWNSTVVDTVPREDLPQAITAMSMAWNGARALGPALAGLVFAQLGAGWVFALAVGSAFVMMQAIRRWPPKPHPESRLPAERLWGGTLSGLRFARHSKIILAQLLRTVAYSGTGSALWALLPVIGQRQLGLGAAGFGLLMACLGTGAVAAGLVLGRVRARVGLEALVAVCCLIFAAVMAIAALVPIPWVVYAALVVGGAAWMAVMSTFNTATQTSAPPWVRSRAAALHTLSALGSFAIGSAFWGAVSGVAGIPVALCVAAACMALGPLLARPFPLRMGEVGEVTPGTPWQELFIEAEPDPNDGPVAVEIGYRIRAGEAAEFLNAVTRLRAPRRRDGATFWRIYRDLSDSSRYVERFIVTSWAEYLHQRARATMADQALEAQVREFLAPGEAVTMQHYIAER